MLTLIKHRRVSTYLLNTTYNFIHKTTQFRAISPYKNISNNIGEKLLKAPLLLMPKEYPKSANFISGSMSLCPQERLYLTANTVEAEFYRKILIVYKAKVFFDLFYTSEISEDARLQKGFELLFGFIEGLEIHKSICNLVHDKKFCTYMQHFTVVNGYPIKFDFKRFKRFCSPELGCSSFENYIIEMQSLVEAFIIKKYLITHFSNAPHVIYDLINLECPGGAIWFNPEDNHLRAKQLHVDAVGVNVITGQTDPIDVKIYEVASLGANRISVVPNTKKMIYQMLNNYNVGINNYASLMPKTHIVHRFKNFIMQVINDKKLTAEVKLQKIIKEICKQKFNEDFKDINVSLILLIDKDEAFSDYYNKILKNTLDNFKGDTTFIKHDFPINGCFKITLEEQKENALDFIDRWFESPFKEIIKENYIKTLTNEYL